jgi:hypothetical protein
VNEALSAILRPVVAPFATTLSSQASSTLSINRQILNR